MAKITGTVVVRFTGNSSLTDAIKEAERMQSTLESALKNEWQTSRCEPDMKTFEYVQISKFSKIKKGEYFKFPGKKKVYKFTGGTKNFTYVPTDDVNDYKQTKTDREIEIGFTY